jgi:tRNA-splicing ligase RtcB
MADGHWGYGFPIGGAAAVDIEEGVISPGGIGFDINCGMKLLRTSLTEEEVRPVLEKLVDALYSRIPTGTGKKGFLSLSKPEFQSLTEEGLGWCRKRGYADDADIDRTEERGCMQGADSSKVSSQAHERGYKQVGTLGSGNHYLEIQVARPENIADEKTAEALGISMPYQILVMIHCGSRGFGHQIASDYVKRFVKKAGPIYGIELPDRNLACAPLQSEDGQDYFAAMKCAVNMAFVNRQIIVHMVREVFSEIFGKPADELGMGTVYDVTHNTAKIETHTIDGKEKELLIHRKGATRSFGPGMEGLPDAYKAYGQPVILGGSMETGSYLLVGTDEAREAFFTTAHGSGRVMGRRQAKKKFRGTEIRQKLENRGIYVRTGSLPGLAEEAGGAYKSIDEVVEAIHRAGLSKKVVRLVPIGNIKG